MDFLQGIEHPVMREQARDYFINQNFRRDLYVRGANRLSAAEQRDALLRSRFVLLQAIENIPDTVTGPAGAASLQAEIYSPVLAALAANAYAAKTLQQLSMAVGSVSYDDLVQAVTVLIGMGVAAPCQSEAAERQVQERCDTLNLQLCKRALFNSDIQVLASPVTGGGVAVSRVQQLFLISLKQGMTDPQDWAQLAWAVIGEQGEVLLRGDQPLLTAEENLAEMTEQARAFAQTPLDILMALKIA